MAGASACGPTLHIRLRLGLIGPLEAQARVPYDKVSAAQVWLP